MSPDQTRPPKPRPSPPPDPATIPAALREMDRWVVWRWAFRKGKWTKPPYDPAADRPTDATDRSAWMPFARALGLSARFDGIGFAVSDTPFVGVDLDGCLDDAGAMAPWAGAIVGRLASYTEVTPSGRGLRVWVRGELPPGRRRKGPVEFYDSGRYFTVTGRAWPGSPAEILPRQAELAAVHAGVFGPEALPSPAPKPAPAGPSDLTDREVLDRMFRARNGAAVEALFRGDPGRHHSGSEADLALCSHLAFWTGGDVDAIDRLFRQSALYDEKWATRPDYRERTIARALEGRSFYNPRFRKAVLNGYAGAAAGGGPGHPPPGEGDGPGGGGDAPAPRPGEGVDDPHRLARAFLDAGRTPDGEATLAYWNEQWHAWDGAAWRPRPDKEVHAMLTRAIKAEFDRDALAAGGLAKPVTTKALGNVAQALRDAALLEMARCPRQPAWIGRAEPGEDLPDPREVLPARNALVHLPSLAAGEPYLLRPTPRFFSPNTLGYDFEPDPGEPAAWLEFLDTLWPDDPESVDCLQEWFGYLLTPDTSQQKMLMLIGPKRSGKGTIGRVLRALVGPDNVAAPTLSGLATNFGLQPLIGKPVALISDARLSGRADGQVIVERLLSISGEDAQEIDRKHLSSWNGTLPTRFVLISNELPRLGDSSGALPSRMVLLRMTRSFYGQEDHALTGRLLAERTAILRWAIEGWRRLRGRGRFVQPESGRELIDDLDELSSPVGTFVAERCEVSERASVPVKDLFAAWKDFCREKGRDHPGDEQGFGRNLRAVLPQLRMRRSGSDGARVREYQGIELKQALF